MSDNDLQGELESFGARLPSVRKQEPRNLLAYIRASRTHEQKVLYGREEHHTRPPTFGEFEKRLQSIADTNRVLARSIILDAQITHGNALQRMRASLMQYFTRSGIEQADALLALQIKDVEIVTQDLSAYAHTLDARVMGLEEYYDRTLGRLISQFDTVTHQHQKLDDASSLLQRTHEAAQHAEGFHKQTEFAYASRKIRRRISSEVANLHRNKKAIELLQKELPLLDGLSGVAEAYSHALKDAAQESQFVAHHLQNMRGLYHDMTGTRTILTKLYTEIDALNHYSTAMVVSLAQGAEAIVARATHNSFLPEGQVSLEGVLHRIEDVHYNAFTEMEDRIKAYGIKNA